jgi:hypothetical protein
MLKKSLEVSMDQ